MIRKPLIVIALFLFGLIFSQISKSYDDKTTHPALTDEMVDLYNAVSEIKLTPEEKELVVQGSIDEDLPPRWVNHFYDPIYNEGWKAQNLGRMPSLTLKAISKVFLNSSTEIVSSKRWAHDELLQLRYANYGGNNTWENALRQYVRGNKKEAYYILGHILHLLEDATVPDHTRNDTHAHEGEIVGDVGSPYEDYGKKFTRQSLNIIQDLLNAGKRPVVLASLDEYFDKLAGYSNGYFFSEDTINYEKYNNPKIIREDKNYGYGKDKNGKEFALVEIELVTKDDFGIEKNYTLRNADVLSSYFSRLSQAAVLNGAGVIALFHNEAEKAARGELRIPDEPRLSWRQIEMHSPYYGFFKPILIPSALSAYDTTIDAAALIYETSKYAALTAYQTTKSVALTAYQVTKDTAVSAYQTISSTLSNFSPSWFSGFVGGAVVRQTAALPIAPSPANLSSSPDDISEPVVLPPIPAFVSTAPTNIPVPTPAPAPTPRLKITEAKPPGDASPVVKLTAPELSPEAKPRQNIGSASVSTTTVATTTPVVLAYQGGGYVSGVSPDVAAAAEQNPIDGGENPDREITIAASTEPTASSTENISDLAVKLPTGSSTAATEDTSTPALAAEPSIVYGDPVVINEIAWMGTPAQSNDEWIELYNKTDSDIDLTGWTLESKNKVLHIRLSGTIKANSYFLLERTASTTTDRAEDMIFTGAINNSGPEASLYLKNGSTTIDYIDFGRWPAGDNGSKKTMERVSSYAVGNNSANWLTYSEQFTPPFAQDAKGNNILGTPGAKNSVAGFYTPASHIIKDTVWEKKASPYLIYHYSTPLAVSSSSTLTIEPGVVVKFAASASFNIEGVLRAAGTELEPIIFTSLADDDADGVDSDRNGTSTIPAPGDWRSVNFLNPNRPSALTYIQTRYGGQGALTRPGCSNCFAYVGAFSIKNSSPAISHSVFTDNTAVAIYIQGDSYPQISQNRIASSTAPLYNPNHQYSFGIYLADASSTAEIIGNHFENNTVAIAARSAAAASLVVRDNTFRANQKNAEFYGIGGINLDNANNRDLDSKGGFHIAFRVTNGRSVVLKADTMPYIFDNGEFITVNEGGALAIEPGTVLKSKNVVHSIKGTLTARGTAEQPIIFTSLHDDADGYDSDFLETLPKEGDWKNIQFSGASSSDSVLEYVVFKYAGQGTNHNPNGWYPTYTGSVSIQDSSPKIINVRIENSLGVAINIKGNSYPLIKNSVIKDTVTPSGYFGAPTNNYGLQLSDAAASAEVSGNTFEHNDIAIRSESVADNPLVVRDNLFSGNNRNGVFTSYPNFNLDNSGNRDINQKGGFYLNLYITAGQRKTLKADTMPYLMSDARVLAGGILVIEPGVVIKIGNASANYFQVNGTLTARGTAEQPIIFTSRHDDADGYDSDFLETLPKEGDWKNIQFSGASSSDSVLEYVQIKYGGSGQDTCPQAYLGGPCMAYEGAVLIDNSSPTVHQSTFDRNLAIALYIKGDAHPTISASAFTNTKTAVAASRATIGGFGISIGAESSPTLDNNTYGGNLQDVVYR